MSYGQRQVLDEQLSTQAYYAAETGINDALYAIINNPAEIPKGEDTDCKPTPLLPGGTPPNPVISSGDTTVSYSCQLITSGTKDILIDGKEGATKTFPIYTDGAAQSVTIEWDDDTDNNVFSSPALGGLQDTERSN